MIPPQTPGVYTRVEAECNASTVTLLVVGGNERGSLKCETVKYDHESQGTRARERLRWRGSAVYIRKKDTWGSTPRLNDWLTVSRNVTLTLAWCLPNPLCRRHLPVRDRSKGGFLLSENSSAVSAQWRPGVSAGILKSMKIRLRGFTFLAVVDRLSLILHWMGETFHL
jgi:hypothetical protein